MSVILKISDDLGESKGEPHFTSWVYYASKKYKCAFWIEKSEFNKNTIKKIEVEVVIMNLKPFESNERFLRLFSGFTSRTILNLVEKHLHEERLELIEYMNN